MLRTYKDDYEFYSSLPRKRIGACALLYYKKELLIVQPTYHSGWILPGGTVEAEESPLEGLHREIKEELGLTVEAHELLSVDYVFNLDVRGEYVQLLFACRELTEQQVQSIQLNPYELNKFLLVSVEKALTLLAPPVARRVQSTLKNLSLSHSGIYLENGIPPTLIKES